MHFFSVKDQTNFVIVEMWNSLWVYEYIYFTVHVCMEKLSKTEKVFVDSKHYNVIWKLKKI